jgi:hypothetical protein
MILTESKALISEINNIHVIYKVVNIKVITYFIFLIEKLQMNPTQADEKLLNSIF